MDEYILYGHSIMLSIPTPSDFRISPCKYLLGPADVHCPVQLGGRQDESAGQARDAADTRMRKESAYGGRIGQWPSGLRQSNTSTMLLVESRSWMARVLARNIVSMTVVEQLPRRIHTILGGAP